MRLWYRMLENGTEVGKQVDEPMKWFQIPPLPEQVPYAQKTQRDEKNAITNLMWNHELQLASAPSEEWNAHHWIFTMKNQGKNNSLETEDIQSQSLEEMNQQKDP